MLLRLHHYHIQASWFQDNFVCPRELLSRDATFKRMEEWISNWCMVWRCLQYSAIIFFSDRSDTVLRENGFLIVSLKREFEKWNWYEYWWTCYFIQFMWKHGSSLSEVLHPFSGVSMWAFSSIKVISVYICYFSNNCLELCRCGNAAWWKSWNI